MTRPSDRGGGSRGDPPDRSRGSRSGPRRGSSDGAGLGNTLAGAIALARDDRAVSAVVGKTLEAGIVVLYISMMVGVIYGGIGPEYERTAGEELGERALAESVLEVQSAVPSSPDATATVRHELPRTIDDESYRIVARNGSLVLVHEDGSIGGEIPLALPPDVARVEGSWESTAPAIVQVETTPAGRIVELEAGAE